MVSGTERALNAPPASRNTSATLDAIQLMLRDLHTRHE